MLPEDECARMSRLAEVIEEVTGADFDTAAQLAQDVISKAAHLRSLEGLRAYIQGRPDESYGPDGELLPYGRCDTCGAPCSAERCTVSAAHETAAG